MKSIINNIILLSALIFSAQAISSIKIANQATDTIYLKNDCAGVNNCATSLGEIIFWIESTRQPDISNPLLVKIGTGTFFTLPGSFISSGSFCKNSGFITFMGSGKENTILKNPNAFNMIGISIKNCQSISFQDLTFDFRDTIYGIYWTGGGNSNFSNIQLLGGAFAWYDDCSTPLPSTHYFIGSQISAKTSRASVTSAFLTRCADTWIIGSEVVAELGSAGVVKTIVAATDSLSKPEVHIYGSNIRAISGTGIFDSELIAASSENAEIHIHGTGIDVISAEDNDIIALRAVDGGKIHSNQSGFVMKTGDGGTKTRLSQVRNGKIIAPYVWGDYSVASGITSIHGADISISTDNPEQQPHLLIYSTKCPSSWFDSTENQCFIN